MPKQLHPSNQYDVERDRERTKRMVVRVSVAAIVTLTLAAVGVVAGTHEGAPPGGITINVELPKP